MSPFIIFSFFFTFIVMLIVAKRGDIFNKKSFLQAIIYALIIAVPVILLPPVVVKVGHSVITKQVPSMGWIPALQGLSILYLVKFIYATIVAFIFCTRLESIIGLSDEKELQLYGATTQGVIFRKWHHRHLRFVRAEYEINGKRFETDSKIDRKNLFSENDKVTVLYSNRYPLISIITELTDQDLNSKSKLIS